MPRADYVISPYGRATCPVCNGTFNLTAAGRMRHHTDIAKRSTSWPYRSPRCEGVGQPPKAGA